MNYFEKYTKYGIYRMHTLFQRIYPLKVNKEDKKIFLFGRPNYLNYGDLAIAVAEIDFISRLCPERKLIVLSEGSQLSKIPKIKKIINDDDIIIFHGGGNMNDLYPWIDEGRIKIIKSFPKNKIVFFPQSVDYDLNNKDSLFFKLKDAMSNSHNLICFARDTYSFNFMNNNFPNNTKSFLVPDIVLSFRPGKNRNNTKKILTILRNDVEKANEEKKDKLIQKLAQEYNVFNSDTSDPYWLHIVTKRNLRSLVMAKIGEFLNAKLVVTDRLHGMIFATITGTPVIAFDNSSHKVSHFYNNWLKKVPYVVLANDYNNVVDLKNIADKYISKEKNDFDIPDFTEYYSKLKESILR